MARCIKMISMYDAYESKKLEEPIYIKTQCLNQAFGSHNLCKQHIKAKLWADQSRLCAILRCAAEIPNELDGHLLYPQAVYAPGCYDRMHVVCHSCFGKYQRSARKSVQAKRMVWYTEEIDWEITRRTQDYVRRVLFDTGLEPGPTQIKKYRTRQLEKFRPARIPERLYKCKRCECYAERRQLEVIHPSAYGEPEESELFLCWVCRKNSEL